MVIREINIRRATTEDAELLSHLGKITFEETFTGTCTDEDMQNFVNSVFSSTAILNELKDDDDFYFIAFFNNVAAGYIRLKEDYSDYDAIKKYFALELKRLYVLKQYHSQKIGAALMKYALDFAINKKYEIIWLGVWENNEKAKSFYKKFGFKDTGDSHDFPIGNTPQTDNWLIKSLR